MKDWLNSDSVLLRTGIMQPHWCQQIELRAEPDPHTCFGTQKLWRKVAQADFYKVYAGHVPQVMARKNKNYVSKC